MKEEKKAPHIGHRKRIKARYLERGLASLDEKDVLELLLTYTIPRRDVYCAAAELVDRFGSLEAVLSADIAELTCAGLTEHSAVLLKLVNDLMKTPQAALTVKREKLTSLLKTAEYCHSLLKDRAEELVLEIFLYDDNTVADVVKVSEGTPDSAVFPVDSMLVNALRTKVHRVLIAHNHPSGISRPSADDIVATEALSAALNAHGLELTEHVIVTRTECTLLMHHQTISIPAEGGLMPWKEPKD